MKLKKGLVTLFFVGFSLAFNAQIDSLKLDFNLKTRAEGNNGYATLIPEGQNMETKILSRARLGLNYYYEKLEVRIAVQDAGIWGNTESINKNGNVNFFEAWAKYQFTPEFYAKVGKQVLSYDNERLIGETDWAMQGRSFDALKLSYLFNNKWIIEMVATYNNDGKNTIDNNGNIIYSIMDGGEKTKSLQLLHFQTNKNKDFQFSAIALNNLIQNKDGNTKALTTLGVNFKNNFTPKFAMTAFGYYQFGRNTKNQEKSAYDVSLDLHYKATPYWLATIGGELLSGTSYAENPENNTAFSPLYGTNHKFNGYMDYFMFNSSGLNNFYIKNIIGIPKAGTIDIGLHYLAANQNFAKDHSKYLGTELDLVYTYPLSKIFSANFGYSQMFASENMKVWKKVMQPKSFQNFVWIALNFNPKFTLKGNSH